MTEIIDKVSVLFVCMGNKNLALLDQQLRGLWHRIGYKLLPVNCTI